jgi:hypothetical protein
MGEVRNRPKLRLALLQDDKPVRVTVQLPAEVHQDLSAYAKLLGREGDLASDDPAKLIPHMLKRFMIGPSKNFDGLSLKKVKDNALLEVQ